MTQTVENLKEVESAMASKPVRGSIVQGDRINRHKLVGREGSSLALADDICNNYFFAQALRGAMEKTRELQKQLDGEVQRLGQIVDDWKEKYKDKIEWDETNIAEEIWQSSLGHVRFQFIVVPQEGQADFLENELVSLDTAILTDPAFQIVRLVSLLL